MKPLARIPSAALAALLIAGCGSDVEGDAESGGGPGERCEEAIALELSPELVPTRLEGDTTGAHDDLTLDACQALASVAVPGKGSGDLVYRIRTRTPATYRFTLEGTWPSPTALALTTDCGGLVSGDVATCLGSSLVEGEPRPAEVVVEATLQADTDYFLVVDGLHAQGRPDEGPFTVQIGCGCALDETCDPNGACRTRQAGDSCDQALSLTAPSPFDQSVNRAGSTAGQPDSGLVPAACTASGTSFGAATPDRVHDFTAPVAGRYDFTLTSLDGAALGLAAFAGCASSVRDATCVAAVTTPPQLDPDTPTEAVLTLDLGAGDTAALLVDGVGGAVGTYRLAVAPPCVPSCAQCGADDGCGRACGCEVGEYCQAGACLADDALEGNACSNPHTLLGAALPARADGDLSAASQLGPTHDALGCPGVQATGAHVTDEVWRFSAPESGTFEVRVSPLAPGVDPLVYAFSGSDCDASACLAYADAVAAPVAEPERLRLELAAGDDVTIVVGAWRKEATGPYRLEIDRACDARCGDACGQPDGCGGTCACAAGALCEAGACLPAESITGDTCANPRPLIAPTMPFNGRGDIGPGARVTANHSAHACAAFVTGGSSPDEVWSFVAPGVGRYEIALTPDASTSDLMLYAFTDAACKTECAAFTDDVRPGDATPELLTLDVRTAGERYLLVVDAWTPELGGAYAITARLACAPACAADSCGQPDGCGGTCGCGEAAACVAGQCVDHADLPGNTCASPIPLGTAQPALGDLADDLALADLAPTACAGATSGSVPGAAGRDQVFRFTAPTAGAWDITATPRGAPLDLVLYAFAAGDCDGACLGLSDRAPLGAAPEALRLVASAAGQAFDVVVDGRDAAQRGAFEVRARAACSPTCDGIACGQADGCGGTCGCADGALCRADACVDAASVAGDRCELPRALSGLALPYVDAGDLAAFGALADDTDAALCAGGATGAGAPDELWSFVAPDAGPWEITVTPEPGGLLGDLVVYAWDGASCAGACSAWSDTGGPDAPERLLLQARAPGQRFTLAVDAWLAQTTDRYTIRADRPCTPSCAGGRCGDDGCGGTCACGPAEVCGGAGFCVAAEPGDTCASALTLGAGALPWAASGDVGPASGRTDALAATLCGASDDGRDQVWRVVPPGSGSHDVVVRPAAGVDVALHVYVGASCGAGCTRYADDARAGGEERLSLAADGQTPWWIAVESVGAGGAFTVALDRTCSPSCGAGCGDDDGCGGICGCGPGLLCLPATGACAAATSVPGNTCAAPRPLEGQGDRFVGSGDVGPGALLGDDHAADACGMPRAGRGGLDEVWRFVPPLSGDWDIHVSAVGHADLMLYAYADAGCASCLGFADDDQLGGGVERLRLRGLVGGQAVRLVVDAFAASAGGAYTLTARPACDPACTGPGCGQDDGCGGRCGCPGDALCDAATLACVPAADARGNTCASPHVLTLDTATPGDLAAAAFLDDRQNAAGCPNALAFDGSGGPDEVFAFVAPADGLYTIHADPEAGADLLLYAFADPTCAPTSCLAATDLGGPGAGESLTAMLEAGASVRVVVDTWAPSAAGAYSLVVEGP